MTTKPKKNWLRTDEREELVSALEHCADLAAGFKDKPMNWKWLIIALHISVQGAFVCSLRGRDTTGISVLTIKSAKETLKWLKIDSRKNPTPLCPEPNLASIMDLYERVTKEKYLGLKIPKDINKIKEEFSGELKKDLYKKLENIKAHFQKEWKRLPKSIQEKEKR